MDVIDALYKRLEEGEVSTSSFLEEYNQAIRSTFTDRLDTLSRKSRHLQMEICRSRPPGGFGTGGSRPFGTCAMCPACGGSSTSFCRCNGFSGFGGNSMQEQLIQTQSEESKLQKEYDMFCTDLGWNLPRYISILEKKVTVQDEPFMRFLFAQKDRLDQVRQKEKGERDHQIRELNAAVVNYQQELKNLDKERATFEAALVKARQQLDELVKSS
jgi:hypothetical protein